MKQVKIWYDKKDNTTFILKVDAYLELGYEIEHIEGCETLNYAVLVKYSTFEKLGRKLLGGIKRCA